MKRTWTIRAGNSQLGEVVVDDAKIVITFVKEQGVTLVNAYGQNKDDVRAAIIDECKELLNRDDITLV
jgi:hypothetical protein